MIGIFNNDMRQARESRLKNFHRQPPPAQRREAAWRANVEEPYLRLGSLSRTVIERTAFSEMFQEAFHANTIHYAFLTFSGMLHISCGCSQTHLINVGSKFMLTTCQKMLAISLCAVLLSFVLSICSSLLFQYFSVEILS